VGFAVVHLKSHKSPELARWKYNIKIDVEETKLKAQNLGFLCRPYEGQPKNKKCQNGWGEPFPLGQCEISGGSFPSNAKIQISPKMTQIFFFGPELIKPSKISVEAIMPFLEGMVSLVENLEKAEGLMNELAIFLPEVQERFNITTRIQAKVTAMYRLIISSQSTFQELIDDITKKIYGEIEKVYYDMFQGTIDLARNRLNALLDDIVYSQRDFIKLARDSKNPNAEKWEADLNNSLINPFSFGSQPKENSKR
jgi:hypothetical protein